MAEIHFPFGLSFEVDALYRRNGTTAVGFINGKSTVNDWQFPFLGKYELKWGTFRPYADVGLVYRHLSGRSSYTVYYPSSLPTLLTNDPDMAGFAVGGGVTLKFTKFRLSPEVRYTHWLNAAGDYIGPAVASLNSNQAYLLVGFTFYWHWGGERWSTGKNRWLLFLRSVAMNVSAGEPYALLSARIQYFS